LAQNSYARRGKAQQTFLALNTADATINVSNVITLTRDTAQAEVLSLTGSAGAGFTLQTPFGPLDAGMQLIVKNGSGQTCTLKAMTTDGGSTPTTGVSIANAAKGVYVYDGSDWVVYVLSA